MVRADKLFASLLVLALFFGFTVSGEAATLVHEQLVFSDVWARPGLAGHTSAVYMRIANNGPEDVHIVSMTGAVAETIELHETIFEVTFTDGFPREVVRMEHVDSFIVPARDVLTLEPGGLHVMLIGLVEALDDGDDFVLEVHFRGDDAPTPVSLPVHVVLGLAADDDDHHH